ncbi:ABC transporter permease [Actinoallomurus bryophytorum]|uniref:Putative ABC transport system permease protein n=1 Tax=Actinoallomurus bryophytorum TaxID=1490222 RepID=A0A543CUR7_9ACTN|nr:FtsX-like permease family protein [Actinoallomurus bryophytorum]TQM00827.1 putative ABC transport system permease protein [Actinoallomurus bryophytorum]
MMTKITLRGLWAHKRRLVGSFLAVFLGVAFLCGTLVLSDTLSASIDRFFTQAYASTDVVVRNATSATADSGTPRGMIPSSVLGQVRQVSGVANAEPVIQGAGSVLGKDGKQVDIQGPRISGNWVGDPALNPYRIAEGRAPQGANEVVINRGLAKSGSLKIGDRTAVFTPERVDVTIVGISTFGSQDAFGGTSFTAFSTEAAQRYIAKSPDRVTSVAIRAQSGVSQDELVKRVRAAGLPQSVEAITGKSVAEENVSVLSDGFLALFRTFLLVFAAVALLVGAFSINNTFSIIIAQRTREWAMLRAIGASRRQILTSVAMEATAIGVVGSVVGLLGGVGVAAALKGVFAGFGLGLPAGGIVFTATAAIVSLIVGIVVTVLSCLVPAVRASRVPPLAALRDVEVEPRTASRRRVIIGAVLAVLGVGSALVSTFIDGNAAMTPAAVGAVVTIAAMIVLGPAVARPAAMALGSPAARLRGVAGVLARQNAARSPRRTSGAATALMIGVGVVTLLTVISASLKSSYADQAGKAFAGDLSIGTGQTSTHSGFSGQLSADVAKLPQVADAAGLGNGTVLLDGAKQTVTTTDPARLDGVLHLDTTAGTLANLGNDQIAVDKKTADDKNWRAGSQVTLRFPDGVTQRFGIGAIYKPSQVAGSVVISQAAVVPHDPQALDTKVLVKLKDGTDLASAKAAIKPVAARYGASDIQDRDQFIKAQSSSMDALLGVVYVMLALAIVIALLGIANTLSLSVYERTRELGLLRAVGTTRSQIRSMIRWESVIVSVFGTIGGLVLGLFLGWALVHAVAQGGTGTGTFSVPAPQLIIIAVVGAIAGVLAAIRPTRRATRLNVLDAIVA